MDVDEFPIEIRHLMLYRQQEQHGKRNWSEFQDYKSSGFEWDKTPEKFAFWSLVISKEDFNVFYDKYPKVEYSKDMPEEIKMLALDRRVEQGWPINSSLGFVWGETPEKGEFWGKIFNKNYSVYYEKYGHPTKTNTSTPSYGGQIIDFPPEVVELMLQRQFEQTGKRDVSVFEREKTSCKDLKGFTWSDTIEDHHFWRDVIECKRFYVFFEKYPKESLINSPIKTSKNEESTTGGALEIRKLTPTITTGERRTATGISGRRSKATIGIGHLSHKATAGR